MSALMIHARDVRYRYAGQNDDAVHGVDLDVNAGELVCIVGPNGSGKTTLLRLLSGVIPPHEGVIQLGDRPVAEWPKRERARFAAVVIQREEPAFPLRVSQTVMLGRYPHLGGLGIPTAADREAVQAALAACDCASLEHRWVHSLSGGEWQRVRLARALAQEPAVLMLDEATSNLDVRHEMETFELTRTLVRDRQLAGVMVTHHVNLAARFADRILVMANGTAAASGPPADVLTADLFQTVFEWPVVVNSWHGTPQFFPLSNLEERTSE